MAERKEYRSSVRSRRMIRQAFQELLNEKEFSKITVTEIVNRADLNRSTFYAHYPDIYGIVEEIQEEIIRRNMELFTKIEFRNMLKDPMPYLQSITATLEENIALFIKLGHTENIHQKLDEYRQLLADDIINKSDIPEEVRSSDFFAIRIHFFLGGIMNTYQQWVEGKVNCTLDQISEHIALLIQQSASSFLETDWMQKI